MSFLCPQGLVFHEDNHLKPLVDSSTFMDSHIAFIVKGMLTVKSSDRTIHSSTHFILVYVAISHSYTFARRDTSSSH